MTDSAGMQVAAGEPQARRAGVVLPATRYRHPGDVIRLIAAALVLAVAGTLAALGPGGLLSPGAVAVSGTPLAAAAPTPGGLGAIESALIAGLTGVGMLAGPAVSAVLLYRLATYWRPVLPGWLSWRFLQRREYL
jgi:glycosyltransferase 2 family protein